MLGERNKLERFTVWGEEEDNRWGIKGINTPRSRTVTVIFQSSEPPRKISELPTSEISADCSPHGWNLRTRKQQGQNSSRSLTFGNGLEFKKDRP
jgi:hypothetical protein